MKSLYLIRHAKSDWNNQNLEDFDRPLNSRGLRDAPFMAKLLKEKIKSLDIIITSPALRAFSTASFFAKAFEIKEAEILKYDGLYMTGYHKALKILQKINNNNANAAVFFHNPDITELASLLSGGYIDNVPTCGIVGLKVLTDKWSNLDLKKCELKFFEAPKKYFKP
jgi:phosphohistidine phosphatase